MAQKLARTRAWTVLSYGALGRGRKAEGLAMGEHRAFRLRGMFGSNRRNLRISDEKCEMAEIS